MNARKERNTVDILLALYEDGKTSRPKIALEDEYSERSVQRILKTNIMLP